MVRADGRCEEVLIVQKRAPLLVTTLCFTALPGLALAQGQSPRLEATDIPKAEIEVVYEALGRGIDQQVKVVDIGGDTQVALGALRRGPTNNEGESLRGLVHHDVTEIYYILDGGGVLVTGGEVKGERQLPADSAAVEELVGPSALATSRGGKSRSVSAGDVVVIPAGVFHGFSHIEDHVTYLSFRVDPERVLPAGYVNPVLK